MTGNTQGKSMDKKRADERMDNISDKSPRTGIIHVVVSIVNAKICRKYIYNECLTNSVNGAKTFIKPLFTCVNSTMHVLALTVLIV